MAVFKATQNKGDSAGKFKATQHRSYDSTLVSEWETSSKEAYEELEKYRRRISSGEFLTSDDLAAYKKAMDRYVDTTRNLRSVSRVLGQGSADDDVAWADSVSKMQKGYKDISDYYSQWKTADDYIFSSSTKTAEERQSHYDDNQKRIEEIKENLPWYAKTYLPDAVEKLFLSDDGDALKDELASLEAANRRYERGEGGYVSKTVDDYNKVTQNADFGTASANRDFANPSRDDLTVYDSLNDSSTWYYDENDVLRDVYGNEIVEDSTGRLVNPNAGQYAVKDRLGIFLSATEKDIEEYRGTIVSGTWGDVIGAGIDGSWKYLEKNEIDIYYYLLNTNGQETADKYLSDMKTELNRRETYARQAHIDEAPILEQILLNIASLPMSVFGGVAALTEDAAHMIRGEDINPYSGAHSFQNTANYARSKTATAINNLTGNAALPWVGTTFGDVYQSIMSFADSALASVIPGGYVLLGLNAASTEMKDLYERGGSTEQLLAGGILAGAAEMFFEKMSIDQLKSIKNMEQKAVKKFADGFVKAMVMGGVEASEEMATEIANTISDALVMGSQTDWVDLGTFAKNVVNAGIGGFISGGLGGAIAAKINNAQYNNQVTQHGQSIIDQGGVDALQQLALEMSGSNKAIGKLSNKVSSEATAKNVGKLSDVIGETTTAQNHADIVKALEEKGLSKKDAKRVAEFLNKAAQGEYFTEQEAAEVEGNEKIIEVLRDVVADPKSPVNTRMIKLIDARLGEAAQETQAQQDEEIVSSNGNLTTKQESVPESHYEVSDDGQMVNTKTGDAIEPQGLVQAKDGTYMIATKDADPVSNSDVSYADSEQALVYETFINLEGKYGKTNKVIGSMDLESRNALLGLYNPAVNKDGGIFASGAVSAFFYGHQGIDLNAVPKTSPVWELTEQQRKIAWNQGRIAGVKSTTAAQSAVDTTYAEAQKALKQTGKAKNGSYHAALEDGITEESLSEKQEAVYRIADDIAQGVKTNIRVYAGKNKAQGFYNPQTDEIWLNLNAANRGREAIMAFTLAHELVHRARKGSPAKYKAFTEFLMKEYGKQGSDVEAMIAEQMTAAEEFNKTVPQSKRVNMTREKALEEVVADACQRMLLDTNAGQKLAEFGAQSKQNKSFLDDLKRWISELLEKLRSYFKGVDPDSMAAKEFAKFDENVKQILADMYVDMSIDAGEKLSTIHAAGDAFVEKVLATRDIQYNLAAVDTHKDKLQKEFSDDSSSDLKTIMARYDKIIDIWTRLGGELNSKFLAEWNSKIGKDRTFTIFKAQSGYKYNVELSSMCKKGVPLFEAIDTIVKQEVMKELGTEVLGKAEKEILYDILKQHHFEIPCAICYVEQARQREGVIIDAFLNGKVDTNSKGVITKVKLGWNQVLDSIEKEMKANGVDYSFAQVSRDIATEKYSPANLDMDSKTQDAFYAALKKIANQEITRYNKAEGKSRKLLTEINEKTVKESLGGNIPNLKIFRVLIEESSSRFKIQNDLLYSSVATQNLSMAHNKLYGLFNMQGGVSGYKTKQGTTIYWGDILGKSWKPDTLRNEGGVRNQSNSDFQMFTLLDQAQMYIDFTAKGYYLQAYTKVLSELKLFGLSRGKINASLIPKVVVYRNADGTVDVEKTMATAGLDENGNPIYDDIEGINHDEAFMLIEDPEYSKSICGICIGYSDAHIEKLLDDNRVQQIIGFHDKTDDGTKRYKGARYAKNYNGLNEAVNKEGTTIHIGFNSYVKKAEKKFQFNAETETFEGTVNYNGKTYTADDIPRLAADLYLEMCAKKEYTPAYKDFAGHRNYYKLLADFGLYDSQGHYAPHRKVVYNMPDTVPYLDADGKKQTMKTYDYIKVELEKELAVRDSISEALADTSSEGIIPQFKAAVKKRQVEMSYSLPKVSPVQPTSSKWGRTHDTDEVKAQFPDLWDVSADESEVRNPTQITGTVKSYRKIYEYLKAEGFNGSILDASSGLGYGTKAGIEEYDFDVEDIEPYPDKSYSPKYTDYSTLHKKYDVIISNAVLNVLPQDQRDALVVKMASLLKNGGRIFINVRGKDVENASSKVAIDKDLMEYYISNTGSYQKGFTKTELVAYLEDALGDGYRVNPTSMFGAVSAVVTKVNPYEGKKLYEDSEVYDYDFMTAQDPMVVATMPPLSTVKEDGIISQDKAVRLGLENAKQLGREIADGQYAVVNAYTRREIIIGQHGLDHSLHGSDISRLRTNARLSAIGGELIRNAIPINGLRNKNRQATGTYALACLVNDNDSKTVAIITVEEHSSKVVDIGYVDITHSVNGRFLGKKRDSRSSTREPRYGLDEAALATAISEVSIADFLKIVNMTHRSILSDNVLQELGESRPAEGYYSGEALFKLPIGEDTSPRALLANAFEGIITNDIEKRRIREYKGKVEMLNAEEKKLRELRAQIRELSFASGKRDTKKIKELQFEAIQTANRIATLDKVLLGLEAAAPLQSILKREKEMAYKRAEQKGKEALEAYKEAERERDAKWQSEVIEKYQASKKKAIETREKREAREKLQKLVLDTVKWITYPTKTDVKCPDILKQPYADFLRSIDLSSKRLADGGDPTKTDLRLANAMGSLATALEKIMTSQDPNQDVDKVLDCGYLDLPANFVKKLRDMTENVNAMMVDGDYVVNNMTADEVRQLSQMIRTLNHAIKEVSTLYANLRFANVEALGDSTMSFMDALGEIEKTGGMKDFVEWDNALPYYAFKRFGAGGESIFEGLMDAQDKLAFLAQEIFNFRDKAWTDEEAKAWSEDTHTIDLPNGNKLTLTTADAMSIYCLSRREQGLQHLLGGGTRVMGIQKGSQKAKDSRSILSIKDIDAINSSLTDRQRAVAEAIQEFMSSVCSEWGNEISMKRFLTKEFTEKFYFPIESNDENLPTKDPAAQQSDLFRLLNISATKPLTPGANNEVIIRNIFDVFTGHASDMARLNAYGMALLDYMKWLNYREKSVNEEDQIKVRGVRKSMELAYGNAAKSYVLNLVKDVNGRPSDNGDPAIWMKMMRNAKIASVGANLRVAALQFTSYPRAAMVLSTRSMALGLTKAPQITKAKKYCGIALWKSFGFYDTNIARSIEDQMKGVTNIRQKVIELSMKGAEWGDAITWGCLWNACEYEVAATSKYEVGSEEFYQAVGKKLREVVYATQVVDSTLTRSQLMRRKSGFAQEAASFMSEPTLTANILMDAGFQFEAEKRRTGSIKVAWNKTGKTIGRAVAVYSCVALFAALVESLGDAWRDDDDEEFYKKFFEELPENALLNMLPFNKVPIISDAVELVLSFFDIGFFSSEKMSTQFLTQIASAVDALGEVFSGKSTATVYGALYKTVKALSSSVGIPISGALREVVAVWNNTAGSFNSAWKLRTYGQTQEDLRNGLYNAIVSGNERQAESIRKEFRDRAEDEKEYQSSLTSAIRKALRENDPRIKVAAQAVVDGNPAERANIAREIAAEGHFSLQDIQAAINAEIDKIRKEAKGK